MSAVVHIATIQGIGDPQGNNGLVKYCYPEVPDYATSDTEYVAGLAERPSVTGAKWDIVSNRLSIGRFNLSFIPGVGPVEWWQVSPPAKTDLREAVDNSTDPYTADISRDPTAILDEDGDAWAAGTVVYCDRETWRITAVAAGAPPTITFSREYAGSEIMAHDGNAEYDGADIFNRPPVLVGRAVTVYETPRVGGSSGDETVVLRGFVSSEPSFGTHQPTISVVNIFHQKVLGVGEKTRSFEVNNDQWILQTAAVSPRGINSDGGYWLFPNNSVTQSEFETAGNTWTAEMDVISGEEYIPENESSRRTPGIWPILYSNIEWKFPSFGRDDLVGGAPTAPSGTFTASDNPFVIVLNILMSSIDGLNFNNDESDAYTYDVGNYETSDGGLWPAFALGIARDQIDLDTFEGLINGTYANLRAPEFWLSGAHPEKAWDAIRRLMAPLGFAVGSNRTGQITVVWLSDVYPGDTTTAINREHTIPRSVRHQTQSRSIDMLTIETDPAPDGKSMNSVVIDETAARSYYTTQVGQSEVFKNAPYQLTQFEDEEADPDEVVDLNMMATLVANRIRRLALAMSVITVELSATLFESIDIADNVTLLDYSIVNPVTGSRMVSGDSPLKGQIVELRADYKTRRPVVKVALVDTGNVCLVAPSAAVAGGAALDFTITDSVYGGSPSDAETFSEGDKIILLNKNLAEISGDIMTITGPPTSTSIKVDANADGYNAGDVLVFADWDDVVASQKTAGYGWDSDGGDGSAAFPSLGAGSEATFVYGD